jgi:hypothetical protein
MSITRTNIKTDVLVKITGTIDDTTLNTLINQAADDVLNDVDTLSTRRVTDLAPRLMDNVYEYTAPTDLKDAKVVDIMPQNGNRSRFNNWEMKTPEEFDRYKKNGFAECFAYNDYYDTENRGNNIMSVSSNMLVRTLMLSSLLGGDDEVRDSINESSYWHEFGDGDNLTTDNTNYVQGGASVNFDISDAGGTTAGIYRDDVNSFDITRLLSDGSEFVWFYITSATNITNVKIRIGSDASNYYEMTATTNNDGTAFGAGWNLIRFDWSGATETGSVDIDDCTYVAIYMTKATGKVSESNYRFNYWIGGVGERVKVVYYSYYPWKSSAGALIYASTADTDLLQAVGKEYDIFMSKLCELCELWLRNTNGSTYWTAKYDKAIKEYLQLNPSQALTINTTYWDLDNYGLY